MARTFIISDESLNSYGFRILNSALKTDNFLKNPIGLWSHNRGWRGSQDDILPICRWENLRLENGQWKAEPVFDMNDEFAAKIADKVEQGIINAASIGVKLLNWSEDSQHLVQGQTRPTVLLCELQEISITDIPSNKNCIALYDIDGNQIELSDKTMGELLPLLSIKTDNDNMKLTELAQVLKLAEGATEQEVLQAVTKAVETVETLAAKEGEVAELTAKLKAFEDAETLAKAQRVTDLTDRAVADKKIVAAEVPLYKKLAEQDFDTTKALLDKMPAVQKLGEKTDGGEKKLSAWDERQEEIRKNSQH